MLNQNALQQLAQLKTQIHSSKKMAQGRVRTTAKRFSFVVLDDGKELFLDPEQTQRVLPNDLVEVEVIEKNKDQFEAKLEKLIESDFKEFVGKYVARGTHFFIDPDVFNFTRGLFVAPQDRKELKENDLVHGVISRHPFSDGKVQIKILKRIGASTDVGIENIYTQCKFNLANQWTPDAKKQADSIHWMPLEFSDDEIDFTQLEFVTIDSESTRDMDDAVHVQRIDNEWLLHVAIANPTKHIQFDSALEKAARERGSTHYLLGQSISMLPSELANDTYSLVPEKKRAALVCEARLAFDGTIKSFAFKEAQIRSAHKLSYEQVAKFLDAKDDTKESHFTDDLQTHLRELKQFADARNSYRQIHSLVINDNVDYEIILNDKKKVDRIERRERNSAQRIVEEAMLLTNLCAGELFVQHPKQGIFSTHIGIKPERIHEAISLIQEDRPDLIAAGLNAETLASLNGFQKLIKSLREPDEAHPQNAALLSLLQRMMQPGSLSFEPKHHFGLGFKAYAMVTSPIRRYNDLFNHLAIKRILKQDTVLETDSDLLINKLQENIGKGRQACRYLENWLTCEFMQAHIDTLHKATITLVNGNGVGVQMEDTGIEGYALLAPKNSDIKAQFDSRRLSLTVNGKTYHLDESVHVLVKEVDMDKRRIAVEIVDEKTAERLSVWTV